MLIPGLSRNQYWIAPSKVPWSPRLVHRPPSGKGVCGQREGVGGSDLESNGQLLISFWRKRLWTALTLMEKGMSSRFKSWPGERIRYKKEATEEGILPYLQLSWNSYPDTIWKFSGTSSAPRERLRRVSLCQVGSINDKLTRVRG